MHPELLLTNIGFIISFTVCLSLGILAFVRRPKENASVNIIFFLNTCAMCLWQASYVIGINLYDPLWSRFAFMFNLATLFAVIMNIHLVLAMSGRLEKQKKFITSLYLIATALVVFFALNPDLFLLPSLPQLYLPNFFVVGPLYSAQDAFFTFALVYLFVQMALAYHDGDMRMRSRLKYFIIAMVYVYGTGLVSEFLLYGIPVDPIATSLVGLYTIPMAYAIIKYDLIDITVIAKRALGYAISIAGVTLFILFVGYANDTVAYFIPGFPLWLLPLVSAAIAVAAGVFVWRKIKEVDELKYQFVDVVTHKFRTPLTYIRWSLDTLKAPGQEKDKESALASIEDANSRLFELTNSLTGLSGSDNSQYLYAYSDQSIPELVSEAVKSAASRLREKNISVDVSIPETFPVISMDRQRMQFVIQMIIDNAVTYSPDGGKIIIRAEQKNEYITLSVRDFGIGISKEDLSRLFSKFFRGQNAAQAHTEGLGIGLYLSHEIVKRHGGKLWAESGGSGTGSTFFMKLPVRK